jgi:hypothetical protein
LVEDSLYNPIELIICMKIPKTRLKFNKKNQKKLALWAADSAEEILPYFEEKYPKDNKPRKAIEAARAWVRGEIRVDEARKASLASHAAAREALKGNNLAACFAARAAGHAVATAHVPRHAYGVTYYAEKLQKVLDKDNNISNANN